MSGECANNRQVVKLTGADRVSFLQGLVSNDVAKLDQGLVYAALLSPQGKYLADFFLVPWQDAILIDVDAELATDLLRRLNMYRLRADVALDPLELSVTRGLGAPPEGAFVDPRHPALGWRQYGDDAGAASDTDWDALHVAYAVPRSGAELIPNDSYILEMGFERLNGVDFRKGCYVGQEVTARMKHKTELRKGLARVTLDGSAAPGDEILAQGKPVGRLHSVAGQNGLAYLRFDRAQGEMEAGGTAVRLAEPKG